MKGDPREPGDPLPADNLNALLGELNSVFSETPEAIQLYQASGGDNSLAGDLMSGRINRPAAKLVEGLEQLATAIEESSAEASDRLPEIGETLEIVVTDELVGPQILADSEKGRDLVFWYAPVKDFELQKMPETKLTSALLSAAAQQVESRAELIQAARRVRDLFAQVEEPERVNLPRFILLADNPAVMVALATGEDEDFSLALKVSQDLRDYLGLSDDSLTVNTKTLLNLYDLYHDRDPMSADSLILGARQMIGASKEAVPARGIYDQVSRLYQISQAPEDLELLERLTDRLLAQFAMWPERLVIGDAQRPEIAEDIIGRKADKQTMAAYFHSLANPGSYQNAGIAGGIRESRIPEPEKVWDIAVRSLKIVAYNNNVDLDERFALVDAVMEACRWPDLGSLYPRPFAGNIDEVRAIKENLLDRREHHTEQ